jgi:hypothetical protein
MSFPLKNNYCSRRARERCDEDGGFGGDKIIRGEAKIIIIFNFDGVYSV